MDDSKKIGVGLTALGSLLLTLGILLLFDRGLLATGNLLFLAGVALTIGPNGAIRFFVKPRNAKGSAFFFSGFLLVVALGWVMVGMAIEGYGFFLLFRPKFESALHRSNFFPTVISFLRGVPGVSTVLELPAVKSIMNRIAATGSLPL